MLIMDLISLHFVLFIAVQTVSDSKVTSHNMRKFLLFNYQDKVLNIWRYIFFYFYFYTTEQLCDGFPGFRK